MRLLAPMLEAGKVDVVFNGHVHNYQRSYPLRFVPDKQGTLLVGGRDGKTVAGPRRQRPLDARQVVRRHAPTRRPRA